MNGTDDRGLDRRFARQEGRLPDDVDSDFGSVVGMRSRLQRHRSQLYQPFQVLRQCRHQRLFLHPFEGSQTHSPQPHEVLALAEEFLDLLPETLRDRVARAARLALRPCAQRARLVLDRLVRTRDVRLDPAPGGLEAGGSSFGTGFSRISVSSWLT